MLSRLLAEFTICGRSYTSSRLVPFLCVQVANLCSQLPAAGSPEFQTAFLNEYSDSLVVTYLASVTKLTTLANEVRCLDTTLQE